MAITTVRQVIAPAWSLDRMAALADVQQPGIVPDSASNCDIDDPRNCGPLRNYSRAITGGQPGDTVVFEFIVDERGRVVMPSVHVVRSHEGARAPTRTFTARERELLPDFMFDPAVIGECRVPQFVRLELCLPQVVPDTVR